MGGKLQALLPSPAKHSSTIGAEIIVISRPHCSDFPSYTRNGGNNNVDYNNLGDGNHDENSNTTGDAGTVENEDNRYYY